MSDRKAEMARVIEMTRAQFEEVSDHIGGALDTYRELMDDSEYVSDHVVAAHLEQARHYQKLALLSLCLANAEQEKLRGGRRIV